MNWGSVAEWVAAVGALLGAGATVFSTLVIGVGLLIEINARRRDTERAAQVLRDAEADQARLVSVQLKTLGEQFEIKIINDSGGPIRKVTFTACLPRPGGTQRVPGIDTYVVAAGSDKSVMASVPSHRDTGQPIDDYDPEQVDVEVDFVDTHGRQWRVAATEDTLYRLVEGTPVRVL